MVIRLGAVGLQCDDVEAAASGGWDEANDENDDGQVDFALTADSLDTGNWVLETAADDNAPTGRCGAAAADSDDEVAAAAERNTVPAVDADQPVPLPTHCGFAFLRRRSTDTAKGTKQLLGCTITLVFSADTAGPSNTQPILDVPATMMISGPLSGQFCILHHEIEQMVGTHAKNKKLDQL